MTCDFKSRSPGLFDELYDIFLLPKCAFFLMAFISGVCCNDFFQSSEEVWVAFGILIPQLCRRLS